MPLEVVQQSLTVYPGDRQPFRARSTRADAPMWCNVSHGFVRADYSIQHEPLVDTANFSAESAHQLMSGIGAIEFKLTANSLPGTGSIRFSAFFIKDTLPNWAYNVSVGLTSITITNESGSTLATLNHTPAIGDRFKIELAGGFRLFVNGVLRHERVSGFASPIRYPAWYEAFVFTPVGTQPYAIPAPLLSGSDWQLRPLNKDGIAVVVFTTPSHGSLDPGADALEKIYFNGSAPGAYLLPALIKPGDDAYMEDAVPAGATQFTSGGDAWTFGASSPVPITGNSRHKSNNVAGAHAHWFTGSTTKLLIDPGDVVYCWVFPDGTNVPTSLMLSWNCTDSTGFAHRAYWGPNNFTAGTDGTPSRRRMGDMPPTGQWTRLEVPASLVDLEGRAVDGMAFDLYDGVSSWDQAGKYPGKLQYGEALITIPALQVLGPTARTLLPSAKTRFQTNYDAAQTKIVNWAVIGGYGSVTQDEFTAGSPPGLSIVRATVTGSDQVANIQVTVPPVITNANNYKVAKVSEQIDFDTNIPVFPTYIGAGAFVEGTTFVDPPLPAAIQPKDVMLLLVETANEVVSAPTGWLEHPDSPQGTGTAGDPAATRLTIFWRRATEIEVVPRVLDPGDHVGAQILAWRDCVDTGNPWDVGAGNTGASSTSVSIPGDTTTVVNTLVIVAVSHGTDTATPQVSGFTNSDLVNLTELTDVSAVAGNGGGFAVAQGEKASIGTYGATTATLANASTQGRISLALKPALITWSASIGTINSTSGLWTAPSLAGQTAKITVTNGNFSATIEIPVYLAFPLTRFATPIRWRRSKNVLVSEAEDGTRVARVKNKDGRARELYEDLRVTLLTKTELESIEAFWDDAYPSKQFIIENIPKGVRRIVYFDSDLAIQGNARAWEVAFRVKEAA